MKIGDYEVTGELGRGGAGRVLRARAPDGREVAIKVLAGFGPEELARFEREVRLVRELGEAEGFVPLLGSGTSSELGPYLVMPFVRGGTLRDKLNRGPLGASEAATIAIALARALGRAHERGFVHRDVKPENVLFEDSKSTRPLLADLGLAKRHAPGAPGTTSPSLSLTGQFKGSTGYAAPEQLDDSKSAGPAADVFALGCVAYEMLAGRVPFAGGNFYEFATRLARGEGEPLASAAPEVPRALATTVERALARDPAERWPDGEAFAAALEEALEPRRGHGVEIALALAGSVALVGLGAGLALMLVSPPRPAPSASPAIVSPAPAASKAEETRALVARACELELEGDALGTRELVDRALAADPENVAALALRARCRRDADDLEGARADVHRALLRDERSAEAFVSLAYIALKEQDVEGAARNVAAAIELDPRDPRSYYLRAVLAMNRDDAGALADVDRALELAPKFQAPRSLRIQLHNRRGENDRVLPDANLLLDTGLTHAPDEEASLRGWRAIAREAAGEYAGALEDAERGVALAPERTDLLYIRARVRARRDNARGSVADLRHLLALDGNRADAWALLARELDATGDVPGALAAIERALVLDPRSCAVHFTRAEIAEKRGDVATARSELECALEVAPPGSPDAGQARAALDRLEGK